MYYAGLCLQLVTDHLLDQYEELKDITSPDINHHRYRQELRIVHQTPCVPRLGILYHISQW